MAVSVDTVYQRVLALANKEQRGYITPQEFNLFANQIQQDIFEQYFYDINQWSRQHGNDTEFSDMLSLLEEKLSLFEVERGAAGFLNAVGGGMVIPDEIYRLGTIRVGAIQVEMLTSKEFDATRFAPLTAPTPTRPIGYLTSAGLYVATGASTFAAPANINLSYIRKPAKVEWAYVVVNDKALYNDNISVDFELHAAEESELVYRILAFGGIAIKKPELTQTAAGLEQAKVQQEKQ